MDPTRILRSSLNMTQCIMNVQWTTGDILSYHNIVQWTVGDTLVLMNIVQWTAGDILVLMNILQPQTTTYSS